MGSSQNYNISASELTNPKYFIKLFNKENMNAVFGRINLSTLKYLREIIPALAIRHLANPYRIRGVRTDNGAFDSPLGFHMQDGLTICEMLFTETSLTEFEFLRNILNKNLVSHPESQTITEGMSAIIDVLKQEDHTKIKMTIQQYLDRTKNFMLYEGNWQKVNLEDGQVANSKIDIFYTENAIRPFSIRIANCLDTNTDRKLTYPYQETTSYLISLSGEEFITKFLDRIPLNS